MIAAPLLSSAAETIPAPTPDPSPTVAASESEPSGPWRISGAVALHSSSVSAQYTLGTSSVRSRFPALRSALIGSTIWLPANPRIAFESGVFFGEKRFRYGEDVLHEYSFEVPVGMRFFPHPLVSLGAGFFFSGNVGKLAPGWTRTDSGASLVLGAEWPVLERMTAFADLRTELGLSDLTEEADLADVSSTAVQVWLGLRFLGL